MKGFYAIIFLLTIATLFLPSSFNYLAPQSVHAQSCPTATPAFFNTESIGPISDGTAPFRIGTHLIGEEIDVVYTASGATQMESNANDWIVRINGDSSTEIRLRDGTLGPRPPGAERVWKADLGSYSQIATYTLDLIYSPSGIVCSTNSFRITDADTRSSIFQGGVKDPLQGRFTTLGQVASNLLPLILLLGGMIAFIFILWGGIKYMTAQGDPKALSSARGTVVSAIIGLVILASIFAILRLISFVFKINILSSFIAPVFALEHCVNGVNIGCEFKIGDNQSIIEVFPTFGSLFTAVVSFILAAGGLIFFFMLVWGGIRYMTSRGDDKTISSARDTLTNAVIGLLIIVSSFAIIKLISVVTRADISIF